MAPAPAVVLQVSHQVKAARIVQHFQDDITRPKLFPENFATEAVEVGPHGNIDGPCLIHFKNVGLSKEEIFEWFESQILVKRQAVRLYYVDNVLPGSTTREELMAHLAQHLAKEVVHRLYCWPRSSQVPLAEGLFYNHGIEVAARDWQRALMVVQTEDMVGWSVCSPELTFQHATDVPRQFADSVATAVNKVHEAILVSGMNLDNLGWALDLGAAPGGWTKYLAEHAKHVVAIDPAALDPEVLLPNVTHIRKQGSQAVAEVQELMQGQQADLVVSDMNMYPKRAAKTVSDLLPLLRPGGMLIMTLKFPGVGRDRSRAVSDVDHLFEGVLQPGRWKALLANTICEATYYAIKL